MVYQRKLYGKSRPKGVSVERVLRVDRSGVLHEFRKKDALPSFKKPERGFGPPKRKRSSSPDEEGEGAEEVEKKDDMNGVKVGSEGGEAECVKGRLRIRISKKTRLREETRSISPAPKDEEGVQLDAGSETKSIIVDEAVKEAIPPDDEAQDTDGAGKTTEAEYKVEVEGKADVEDVVESEERTDREKGIAVEEKNEDKNSNEERVEEEDSEGEEGNEGEEEYEEENSDSEEEEIDPDSPRSASFWELVPRLREEKKVDGNSE
ncbi:hypothetical protein C8Q75DRAFT_729956 [Abortiporus biennis]|nr:hypothetical protein C8Q75DRAFT_729956 [Abortiporus biennis]